MYERAEGPQAECWFAIFAYKIEVRPVWTPTQLARFGNDRVDALREGIVQKWEGDLPMSDISISRLRSDVGREGATGELEVGERMETTHLAAR